MIFNHFKNEFKVVLKHSLFHNTALTNSLRLPSSSANKEQIKTHLQSTENFKQCLTLW
jgi:hypothetical protein